MKAYRASILRFDDHGQAVFDKDGLLVVGIVGLLIERVLLRGLEVVTVERWGTMRELG